MINHLKQLSSSSSIEKHSFNNKLTGEFISYTIDHVIRINNDASIEEENLSSSASAIENHIPQSLITQNTF